MNFRHEWKHELTPGDVPALRRRLGLVARPDPHAVDGRYRVRSLYFDNAADRALREKLDGISRRDKFRIRCYDLDPATLHLEKKSRRGALGAKAASALTPDQLAQLLRGQTAWLSASADPLLRELGARMTLDGLRPRTIVEYTREPFVFAPGNVRVTLDYDIRTGLGRTDLLAPDCPTIPVPGAPVILEVKWDAFLPDVIRDAVQVPGCRVGAFSKYAACRSYG